MKYHHRIPSPIISFHLLAYILATPNCALAQTTPVTGDFTVTGTLKAGADSSPLTTELRQNGLFIAKGVSLPDFGPGNLTTADQGPGNRMLWYPGKAAFRAGKVFGPQWDDLNIGQYSTAFGVNCIANGWASIAMGSHATADGMYSVAMGLFPFAIYGSSAFGNYTSAFGGYSTAMGSLTLASGGSSTAMGESTSANAYCSTAIGRANVGGGSPYAWVPNEPLFEIGNGSPLIDIPDYQYEPAAPSNALTVYKNGNMDVQGNIEAGGVVTCAPGGDIPMFTGN